MGVRQVSGIYFAYPYPLNWHSPELSQPVPINVLGHYYGDVKYLGITSQAARQVCPVPESENNDDALTPIS